MSKRGDNIYKRKDGRWEGRYRTGYKANGSVKYRSVYGHSYHEVKSKLLPLKAAPSPTTPSGRVTVKTLLSEWMSAVQLKVKASTYANYSMKVERHILPTFGQMRYDQLTAELVHRFIQTKLESGLSGKYVSDIVILLKSMAKYITRVHGYPNAMEHVILPKVEQQELLLLSSPEQKRLFRFLMDNLNPTSLCILLSMYLGLRVGEVCGLMWGDIDFEKSTVTVRRTVQRIHEMHGTRLMIGSPKSKASRRTIPIPSFLLKLLRQFHKDNSYYLLSGKATVIEPRTLQRRFQSILQKSNLPSRGYHCLRHMFATNSLQLGFDVRTLSEILGHASVGTTLSRYVHSSLERKAECMALLQPAV